MTPCTIPYSAEIESLMESRDYVKAEKIARAKKLDRRIIATVMAFEGKKEEAFAMFEDVIKSASEKDKHVLAFQCIHFLTEASPRFGREFFDRIVKDNLISLTQCQKSCQEIKLLIKSHDWIQAKTLFDQLIDTDCKDEELITIAITLQALWEVHSPDTSNSQSWNKLTIAKLRKKFPDNPRVQLQSIELLSKEDPSRALVELEEMQKSHPKLYSETKDFFLLIKGRCLEKLGKLDQSQSVYSELIGTPFESTARLKLECIGRLKNARDQK